MRFYLEGEKSAAVCDVCQRKVPTRMERRDYRPDGDSGFSFASLAHLDLSELLDPLAVARTLGFGGQNHLDTRLAARGYRQVAQISRLPAALGVRLIEHFGNLQALFGASIAELQDVDGVGEGRARVVRDGLLRLADAAYSDRLD